jgi:hypothetical protein
MPCWMSDEYGSLTPSTERIRDFATLARAGNILFHVDIAGEPCGKV